MKFQTLVSELQAKRVGTKGDYLARCPAHDDRSPSLSISENADGKILMKCHAGCPQAAVMSALESRGLWEPPASTNGKPPSVPVAARNGRGLTVPTTPMKIHADADAALAACGLGKPDKTYPYPDGEGTLVGMVGRWNPPDGKTFRQISRMGDGWACKAMPEPRPLFGLPGIIDNEGPVYIVEGEKCCDAMMSLGFLSATSSGGSNAAKSTDWEPLQERTVFFFPDNDEPGRKYLHEVAKKLTTMDHPATVHVVILPDLPEGGDVVDYVERRRLEGADDPTIKTEIEKFCTDASIYELPAVEPEIVSPPAVTSAVTPEIAPTKAKAYGEIEIVNAADVKPEKINWAWPKRFARGKIGILAGDPGLNKSTLAIDIAARVTTGATWPDAPYERAPIGGVLILNAEDGVADTIVPRLISAGADCGRVRILTGINYRDEKTGESIPGWITLDNARALEDAIDQTPDCVLVIIDPITAFLPADCDSHKNSDVRGMLRPIADLAEKTGVAILCISHLTKNSGGSSAVTRITGSLAFAAAARSVWGITRDPDDERGPRRLFLPIKNNIGPDSSGLAFSITTDGGTLSAPRIVWESVPVSVTADDALAFRPRHDAPERAEAETFLCDALSDGPRSVGELQTEARKAGMAWVTVKRAKSELGVVALRHGYGQEGGWVWSLPGSIVEDQRVSP